MSRASGVPPVRLHGGHVGQQQQRVGVQPPRQQRGGEVLVDDRLDAAQPPVAVDRDRDAPTADADDQDAGVMASSLSVCSSTIERGSGDATTRR